MRQAFAIRHFVRFFFGNKGFDVGVCEFAAHGVSKQEMAIFRKGSRKIGGLILFIEKKAPEKAPK